MTIPYKANPGIPGTILRFSTRRARYDEYAYRDLFFSAFALTNTSISVDVLGYENLPSVLILCNEDNAVTARRWLKQLGSGLSDEQSDTKSSELIGDESVDEVYGTGSADTFDDTPAEEDSAGKKGSVASSRYLSEDEFLSGITIDRKTGIHVYYSKSRESAPARMRLVQAAQKYFDIVLVEPGTMEFLDREEKVTVLEYLDAYREPASSDRHVPVRLYSELPKLAKDKRRKPGAYSIKEDYGNTSLRMFTAQAILIQALTEEINPWDGVLFPGLSFKEKMSLLSIRADRDDYSVPVMILGIVSGFLAAFTGMGTGVIETGTAGALTAVLSTVVGAPVVFGAGYVGTSFLSNKGREVIKGYTNRLAVGDKAQLSTTGSSTILLSEHPAIIATGLQLEDDNTIAPRVQQLEITSAETSGENVVGVAGQRGKDSTVATYQHPATTTRLGSAAMAPLIRNVLMKRLKKLTEEWMSYELDPVKALDYPLMLDSSCPQTRSFLMAFQSVQSLVEELDSGEVSLAEFREALLCAEEAFVEAEGYAKKMRYAHLDLAQRKKIRDARPLVALLQDEEATPHEKVSAYRKAGDFLEGIVALPERPVLGLLTESEAADSYAS